MYGENKNTAEDSKNTSACFLFLDNQEFMISVFWRMSLSTSIIILLSPAS